MQSPGSPPLEAPRGFAHVETWVFDLDNTLYPPACDLFAQVDQRMTAFIGDYLKVDAIEARRIQKRFHLEEEEVQLHLSGDHHKVTRPSVRGEMQEEQGGKGGGQRRERGVRYNTWFRTFLPLSQGEK